MMLKAKFVVLLLFFSALAFSAESDQLWNSTWGTDYEGEIGYDVVVGSGDNITVVGLTDGNLLIAKFDSDGNYLWNITWAAENFFYGKSVAVDSDDNIIVGGYSAVVAANDLLVVKFDSEGNYLWNVTWGGDDVDEGHGVAVDSDDNIIATGWTNSFGPGTRDLFVVKFNSSGSQLWNVTWGGPDELEEGYEVFVGSDGSIIAAGVTESFGAGLADLVVVKFNSSGSQLWNATWGGDSGDTGLGVAEDSDGNVVAIGFTMSFGAGQYDLFVTKFNSSGSLLWNVTWGGTGNEGLSNLGDFSVAVNSNDEILATGWTDSFGAGTADLFLTKFDADGNLLWNVTFGGAASDEGSGIDLDSNEDVVVAGYTDSFGLGFSDLLVVKYQGSEEEQSTGEALVSVAPGFNFAMILLVFVLSALIFVNKK